MREDSEYWSQGTPSFRDDVGPRMNARPEFRERGRPFPPPVSGGGGPGYVGGPEYDNPHDRRYSGPGVGGPPANHNEGVQRQMMDQRNAGGMGPPMSGPSGGMRPPPSGYGGMGMPMGGDGNNPTHQQNYGGGAPSESDIMSSIKTLSQIGAQQNDIASKILNAVLSSVPNLGQPNPMNAPGNFPGGHDGPGPMGGNNFSNEPGFHGQNMNTYEDRRPYPPRRSSPPGSRSGRFSGPSRDRFRVDRRETRPSFSSSSYRGRFERQVDVKNRLEYRSSKRERELSDRSSTKRRRVSGDKSDDKRKERHSKEPEVKEKRSEESLDEAKAPENASEEKKEESEEPPKKKPDELPKDALFCHMCNQGNFTSEKTYLFHLEGIRHKKTAVAFRDKNESTLEYLRKNAKLASIRFGGFDSSFAPSKCTVCHAVVKESFRNHKRLLEHKLVSKFLQPKCCGRRFKTRHEMDEHRLSLPHLRRVFQKNELKKQIMEECGEGTQATFTGVMEKLKQKLSSEEEELNLGNLPPFDGNSMIGLSLLEYKEAVLCKPCQMLLPVGPKTVEGHLLSLNHYSALQEYLIKQGKDNKDDDAPSSPREEASTKLKRERGERKDTDDEDSDDELTHHLTAASDEEEENLPFIDEHDHIVLEEVDDNNVDDNDENKEKESAKNDSAEILLGDD